MGKFENTLIFCLFYMCQLLAPCHGDFYNENEKHRKYVLETKKYDKNVIPNHINRNTTNVWVSLYPYSANLIESEQTFELHGVIYLRWADDRLKYDPKNYGRLSFTHFSQNELWIPILTVDNSVQMNNKPFSDAPVLGSPYGYAFWFPHMDIKSLCYVDLTYWPYDSQECQVDLISWTTDGWEVDLLPSGNSSMSDTFKNRHHWKVIDTSFKKVAYQGEATYYYPVLRATFTLKRDSPSFASTVALPALAVALLMLVQFLLPVDHMQRLTVGCVSSIMTLLLLLNLASSLPPLGSSVPLIIRFYGFALFIVVSSVAMSGILIKISHPQNPIFAQPPPAILKTILKGPLSVILCLNDFSSKIGRNFDGDEDGEIISGHKAPDYSHEWLFVATALDRITQLIFTSMYILALFVFIAPVH